MIRQPEFVTREVFAWAAQELAARKPDLPVDKARFEEFDEGLCVQAMHIGPYSTEHETIAKIEGFIRSHGLKCRLGSGGLACFTWLRRFDMLTFGETAKILRASAAAVKAWNQRGVIRGHTHNGKR